jgi:peptidoglycan/LPS O-acetylase OafA/YrhL
MAVLAGHIGWFVAHGGYLGVDMFFVLSGYLITRILVGEHDELGAIALSKFCARRALRLFPALIVAVAGCLIFTRIFTRRFRHGLERRSLIHVLDGRRPLGESN